MSADSTVQRSVTFDVFPPDDHRQAVLNSIRKYRAVCREVYAALLLAQTAGSELEDEDSGPRLKPDGDASKIVLAAALGVAKIARCEEPKVRGEGQKFTVQLGSAFAYELREYVLDRLWPTALSYVWDSIRRDVTTVWSSLDPEYAKTKRGWLALQGARGVAQFNRRGIGIPQATGRPKLDGYTLVLKWDRELGSVTFKLPRLDGGRQYVWANLRDKSEGWKLGTLYLNERDGRIKATVSYSKPAAAASVDPSRICQVKFVADEETLLLIVGPNREQTCDTIGSADVIAWLERHTSKKHHHEAARASCGSPSRPWGYRKGWKANQERVNRLTRMRENQVKTLNHNWARRIVSRAVAWRCGKIEIEGPPEDLAGFPWNWSQFRDLLRYKAEEKQVELVTKNEPISQVGEGSSLGPSPDVRQ
jgi:hypothetical protein